MEGFQKLAVEANRSLQVADHLTYTTYPLVNDVKLLIKISEHIYTAMVMAMEAILQYDRYYKRIGPYPENFDSKIEIFKVRSAKTYNFNREHISSLVELRRLLEHHRKSPVEFVREDKYVMFSKNYVDMKSINVEKIKIYLNSAKPFVERASKIIIRNDRLFRR